MTGENEVLLSRAINFRGIILSYLSGCNISRAPRRSIKCFAIFVSVYKFFFIINSRNFELNICEADAAMHVLLNFSVKIKTI